MYTFNLIMSKFTGGWRWLAWILVVLDFLWELPQNLIGAIVKLVYCRYGSKDVKGPNGNKLTCQCWGMTSGVSLGCFGFANKYASTYTYWHECQGHQRQSLYSGWLYLLIFGLPSLIFCAIYSYTSLIDHSKYSYYDFYTELLADKLGGIPYRGIKYRG